jgi:hypothetical protein
MQQRDRATNLGSGTIEKDERNDERLQGLLFLFLQRFHPNWAILLNYATTAEPATVQKVVEQSDIVILAIPLNKYKQLPADLFAHKLVIDAMNYWPLTEGYSAEFEDDSTSSSEYIQGYLPHTTIVKSLNHVAYNEIEEHSLPKGDPDRRAVLIAGNDVDAKRQVRDFIDDLGFDSVDLGDLQEGKKFQPGTKLFNTRFRAQDLREREAGVA